MRQFSLSPKSMIASTWCHKGLIYAMIKREVTGRYRGSMIGLAWSFFTPLLMLGVYTFVFSVVFQARWGLGAGESKTDFAILLFVGLIVHGLFAECINSAPGLILSNVNYVKRVIFPLEILALVAFGSALFHTFVSLVVLLLAQLILNHHIPFTILWFPVVILPLAFASMGASWFLSALGVYVRDIGQITGIITTVLLFMSAVFFPLSALPPSYQGWLKLNPLVFIIEESRKTLVFGQSPDLLSCSAMLAAGVGLAWIGFACFQKMRSGFADVL